MKLNKNLLIFIIFILLILIFIPHSKVKAASASLSVSKTNVKVGQSVTVSVSINAASWNIEVSGAASINEANSSSSGDNVKKTFSTKFTPKKSGKYTVTLGGDVTDGKNNKVTKLSSSKTITVEEASSNNTSNNPTENNSSTTTTAKSSDATLRNLGVNPKLYDFSGFSKTRTSYSVDVPEDVSSIYIYAYPTSTKAKVSGIGTKSLKKGSKTFQIKVTAEDGKTTKTYSLTVNRTNEEDEENNTTVNNTTENNTTGNNTTDENATNTTSDEVTNVSKSGLTNLEVEGYTISPAFSGDIYTYNVDLPDGTKSININTEKANDDIKVEIIGNDNLEAGTNYITILVYNGDETTTYQVVANVGVTSGESTTATNTNSQNAKNKIKSSWIKIVIVIIAAIFIIYLIAKHKKKDDFDDEDEKDVFNNSDDENDNPYKIDINSYNSGNQPSEGEDNDYLENTENLERTRKHKRAKGRRYK